MLFVKNIIIGFLPEEIITRSINKLRFCIHLMLG